MVASARPILASCAVALRRLVLRGSFVGCWRPVVRRVDEAVGSMNPPRRAVAARVFWAGGRLASASLRCSASAAFRLDRVLAAGAVGGSGVGLRFLRFWPCRAGFCVGFVVGCAVG